MSLHKKTIALVIVLAGLLVGLSIMQTKAATSDSSIQLKMDPSSRLFTLTVRDSDGIQEFSLSPVGQSRYGGGLSGCDKTFSNNNILLDSDGFVPFMPAYIIDCNNNTIKLEIPPPVNGETRSVAVKKEVPPPPPPPPQEEKKEGPLSAEDIQYPVSELGNCQNETECRSYCDNADRAKACFTFAKKYHLISEEDAKEAADKFLNIKKGPGGCNSGSSCEDYCNSIDHLDACIAFAEETGYYSPEELAEARKFQELVKAGTQFPGNCKDRNTCEVYCSASNHMEECLNFAEASGFMPKEEIDEARKFMALMQQGESPGGCTSKEQCENFCSEDGNTEECIAFAEKAGVMTAEEAAMARKVGGKGPGGCKSKTQCETYCQNNGEECFRFAQEHGLMSEDDLAEMREGMARFREELDKMPPEAVQCLKEAAGEENFNKMIAGEPVFDRGIEGKMKSCFSQITAQFSQQFDQLPPEAAQCISDAIGEDGFQKLKSGEFDKDFDFKPLEACFQKLQGSFGGGGNFGAGGFSGPGGCKNTQECSAYCQEHSDECKGFGPPGGSGGGGFSGPGGCTNPEECQAYCQDHQEECKNFTPPGGGATGGQFPGGGATGGGFPGGPGGCKNQEECTAYCKDHQEECKNFVPPGDASGGGFPGGPVRCGTEENPEECQQLEPPHQGGGGGPGGCTNPEECQAYCQAHPQECGGGTGGGGTGGGAVCDYARPPEGCTLIPGPNYNSQTHCGLVSSCPTNKSSTPTVSCAPTPLGLVIGWNGDSLSEPGNTSVGGVTIVPGKVGNAFKFDGSSGYINMGNPANLNFSTGPFSLEAWFNWTGEGAGQVVNNIIRKSNYGPDAGSGYWLRIGQQLEFSVGATTQLDGQTLITAPISSGVWHHAVATKDTSGNMQLYVDGQSRGTVVRQSANTQSTSGSSFTIGAWSDQRSEFFHGLIDEVSVYNRALSASEIQAIFNAGGNGKCTSSSEQQYQQQYDQQYQQSQPPPGFIGPGGCTTPEECTTYCMANYQDPACQQFGPGSQADPLNQGFFARILSAFGPLWGILRIR